MDTESAVIMFRGTERILVVLSGFFSLWIGWSLFKHGIVGMQKAEFEGGGFSFKASKASPGIFFSLFACVILSVSIANPLTVGDSIDTERGSVKDPSRRPSIVYFENNEADETETFLMSINTLETESAKIKALLSEKDALVFGKCIAVQSAWRFGYMEARFGQDFHDYLAAFKNGKDTWQDKARILGKLALFEKIHALMRGVIQ